VLSVDPAGAAVAVIATRAGISVPATRQALLAHEKKGTATRVKGSRPGIADTWQPAAPAAPPADGQIAEAPGAGSTADSGQFVLADGTAETGEAEASTTQEPDPAATAQAADEASAALAVGDLPATLAALDAAREQAACGRRVIKAAASGRRAPATRPGALRDLVEEHLRKFPDPAFTPHQVSKVLTRSAGAVANVLDKLTASAPRRWSPAIPAPTGSPPPAPRPPRRSSAAPVPARRLRPAPPSAVRAGSGRDGSAAAPTTAVPAGLLSSGEVARDG